MTISNEVNKVSYVGDAVETEFDFTFKAFATGDIKVYVDDVLQSSGFSTVLETPPTDGGTVTFTSAPAVDAAVTIVRELDATQEADYPTGGKFPSETHETQLDRQVMLIQQINEALGRAITAPVSSALTSLVIEAIEAGKLLQFNGTGDGVIAVDIGTILETNYEGVLSGLQEGDILTYDVATGTFINEPPSTDLVNDTTPQLGGNLDAQGNDITKLGTVSMTEQAAANADVAGDGQFWVKTATPNVPMFTDDAGTDKELGGGTSCAVIADHQAASTAGGTFTAGAERTRTLNTVVGDPDGIVSISSNQFTLQAGTYKIFFQAPAYGVVYHKATLYDITASAVVGHGTALYTASAAANTSEGFAIVTITSANVYEIQHRCSSTNITNGLGLGVGVSWGTVVYTLVEIEKVA